MAGRKRRPISAAIDCSPTATWRDRRNGGFTDGDGAIQSIRLEARLLVNNGDAIRSACLAGGGIAVLPTFLIADDLCEGRLVRILPEHDHEFGGIYAIWPHSRHLSPKVRVFVDFLAKRFGDRPDWDLPFLEAAE